VELGSSLTGDQLPWRWLSITSMACSLLLSLSIPFWVRLLKTKMRLAGDFRGCRHIVNLTGVFGGFTSIREARWLTPSQFEQTLSAIPGSLSVYQWLPIWVHDPLQR